MRSLPEITEPTEGLIPSQALESSSKEGIPQEIIAQVRADLQRLEIENGHAWQVLCSSIHTTDSSSNKEQEARIETQKIDLLHRIGMTLLSGKHLNAADGMTWNKRIAGLQMPKDFLALFTILGIPDEKWRSGFWLKQHAGKSKEEGGIDLKLAGLACAIEERFKRHPEFVAWMDGKNAAEQNWIEKIKPCKTPQDFLQLFAKLNIPEQSWRSSEWLQQKSKLPISDGGVGQRLGGLYRAIFMRFESWSLFLAWMDGKEEPDLGWVERVNQCESPEKMLALFTEIGIPENKWRNSHWMRTVAHLPPEQGGIILGLQGLAQALRKRFGKHRDFLVWMDGEETTSTPVIQRVKNCQSREDFLELFTALGIPENKWRNSKWLCELSKLLAEEGGIGRNLSGLYSAIQLDDRFKSLTQFVAWMDHKEQPDASVAERVAACKTREDFLRLLNELGVPEGKWRTRNWMNRRAKLPPSEGGMGKNMTGFVGGIQKHENFNGSYAQFVAWMDGKDAPDPSMKDRVIACETKEDLLDLFSELGIPGENWRSCAWLRKDSKLPMEEGGIGRSMAGLSEGLNARFGSHVLFLTWMDRKDAPDKSMLERERSCMTRTDFLRLFEEIGIPNDSWRSLSWFRRIAPLPPEKGGIRKTLAGLARAFETDPRFPRFEDFVVWMDGYPEEGILSTKVAQELLSREAHRLGTTLDELLDPEKIGDFELKSPLLRRILDFFDNSEN